MEQTQAASSPAEITDVFQGQDISLDEYSRYRQDGTLPARFKPAEESESATDDAPEETVVEPEGDEPETDSESEPEEEEAQEPPQKVSPAQKRILQLLAENKELKRKAEAALKPTQADSSTAQPAQPAQQFTRPKPTVEDKSADGKPKYAAYEDYIEDLADWKAEQQLARFKHEQAQQQQAQAAKARIEEARQRYGDDFDVVIEPTAGAIMSNPAIPLEVKRMMATSDDLGSLLLTIGGDPQTMEKLVQTAKADPIKAMRYIATLEAQIQQEIGKEAVETEGGKAPEKRQSKAPKPPTPVGGARSAAFDVSDESLSADEWARQRNAQLNRRK